MNNGALATGMVVGSGCNFTTVRPSDIGVFLLRPLDRAMAEHWLKSDKRQTSVVRPSDLAGSHSFRQTSKHQIATKAVVGPKSSPSTFSRELDKQSQKQAYSENDAARVIQRGWRRLKSLDLSSAAAQHMAELAMSKALQEQVS
jgi:hypothetical protein